MGLIDSHIQNIFHFREMQWQTPLESFKFQACSFKTSGLALLKLSCRPQPPPTSARAWDEPTAGVTPPFKKLLPVPIEVFFSYENDSRVQCGNRAGR